MGRLVSLLGLCAVALCLVASSSCGGRAPEREELASMRKEIDELKQRQGDLEQRVRELKGEPALKSVTPARTQQPFDVDEGGAAWAKKGSKQAGVVVVEFSDFQCTFCAQFVRDTWPQLERDYVKTGKVRLSFRDLPLPIHPNAFRAAEAARCAGEQGRFWEAHDRFFANQDVLNPNDWPGHAQALKLDAAKFTRCLEGGRYDDDIRRDVDEGQSLGLEGTPAFLIGTPADDGAKVHVTKVLLGAESYDTFKETIDALLAAPKK